MITAAHLTPLNSRHFSSPVHQDHLTLAMHKEAENALAMALHYLRFSGGNVSGATR